MLLNAPLPIPGTCDPCKAKVANDDDLPLTPIKDGHEPALPPQSTVPLLLALLLLSLAGARTQSSPDALRQAFANPPDNARIMMRWWWFGPAVTKPELQRELEQMKAAGIGGVEIATLYPLALDDPATGFHNLPFLSDEYIDDLRFAAQQAARSGCAWTSRSTAAGPSAARTSRSPRPPASCASNACRSIPGCDPSLPRRSKPAKSSSPSSWRRARARAWTCATPSLRTAARDGRLDIGAPEQQPRTALFFISSRTGMTVKRPAIGAEGFVLDHYSQQAIDTHLHAVGDRLLQAFDAHPPYAVFSDSLEDYGSDWTPDLLEQFRPAAVTTSRLTCPRWSETPAPTPPPSATTGAER